MKIRLQDWHPLSINRSKSATILIVFLLVVAPAVHSLFAQADFDPEEIKALEQERISHLLNGDWDALAEILSPTLTYTHSTGVVETKEEFLEAVKTERVTYLEMNHRDVSVRQAGTDAAIMTGLSDVVLLSGENRIEVTLRFTLIYSKSKDRLQLEAWHSVRSQ